MRKPVALTIWKYTEQTQNAYPRTDPCAFENTAHHRLFLPLAWDFLASPEDFHLIFLLHFTEILERIVSRYGFSFL